MARNNDIAPTSIEFEPSKQRHIDYDDVVSNNRVSLCNARPSTITHVLIVYHIALVLAFGYAFFPYTLFYGLWLTSVIFIFALCSLHMKKAVLLYPFIIWVVSAFPVPLLRAVTFVLFILLGAYLFFYTIFVSTSISKGSSVSHSNSTASIVIHLTNVIFCLFHLWQIHVVDLCRKELNTPIRATACEIDPDIL